MIVLLKKYCTIIFVFLFLFSILVYGEDSEINISASSAVLMNADTGKVIYEKNAYKVCSMASTTKIMTSLIALEQGTPNRIIKITDEMLNVEGTSIGLKAGDLISLKGLAYGMLLESGNDAANSTAIAIGETLNCFSEIMNNKAKAIGMKSTNFVTPSGLDDENHYTTAYDMAVLGSYAIKNPDFVSITSSKKAEVTFGNPPKVQTLYNHNKMLNMYDGTIGIKTGFTKKSGRCLVTAAKKNGINLVCVVLSAPDDWNDTIKLLDYGFENQKNVEIDDYKLEFKLNIVGGVKNSAALTLSNMPKYSGITNDELDKIIVKTYLKKFEYAPVKQGQVVGYNIYYIDDVEILKIPIIINSNVKKLN